MFTCRRNLAITSNLAPDYEDTGKIIISGPGITNVADLQSTDSNKTIEVIIYRKWISMHNKTHQPTRYCCILIDKQGTPIQTNMDVNDVEYFDELLQMHTAYRISVIPVDTGSSLIRIGCYSGVECLVLVPSEFVEGPCTRKKTPLTLSWERIPRLDSGVRVSV
ncbi:DNA helicase [Tanacetum coccineum]